MRQVSLNWVGGVLVAALVGLLIVAVPLGLMLKLLIMAGFCLIVVLAWVARSEANRDPSRLIIFLSAVALFLSIVWPRYIFFQLGGAGINPQTLSVLLVYAVSIPVLISVPGAYRRICGLNFFGHGVGQLVVLWIVWRFASAVLGLYPLDSVALLLRDIFYLMGFLFIGQMMLSDPDGERVALRIILICTWFVVLVGLVEAVQQRNLFVKYASGGDGDAAAEAIRSLIVEKVRGGKYRAQSVFSHPIVFSQFVAASLPLTMITILRDRGLFWRFSALLLVPAGVAALVVSGSRSGLVGLISVVGFISFLMWVRALRTSGSSRTVAIIILPVVLFGAGLMIYALQDLLLGRSRIEAGSTEARQTMIHLGMQALQERPLLGFGEGLAVQKAGLTDSSGHTSIDSYLLSVAVDSGYVGFALFVAICALYLYLGARAVVLSRLKDAVELSAVLGAFFGVLISFLGLSITHNMTFLWFCMMWGFALMARLRVSDPERALR